MNERRNALITGASAGPGVRSSLPVARPLDAVSDYSALFPQAFVISTGVELRMAPNCRVPTGIRHGSGAIGVDLFHGVAIIYASHPVPDGR